MSEPIAAPKPSSPNKPLAAILGGAESEDCFRLGLVGADPLRDGHFRPQHQIERRPALPVVADIEAPGCRSSDFLTVESMARLLLAAEFCRAGSIHLFHRSFHCRGEKGLRIAACLASASARRG